MIYLRNGVRINPDAGFQVDGVQYPPGWLRKVSGEQLAALGITTRNDMPMPEPRWYESSQNSDGSWNVRQRDLTAMADALKVQIKATARGRILDICPEWRQTNLVARGVEVLLTMAATDLPFSGLPAETKAEITAGLSMWQQIKQIRDRSGAIEAKIDQTIARNDISYSDKVAILQSILEPDSAEWSL